jgi:hypothetical protein
MKRLIKKSEYDPIKFILNWFMNYKIDNSKVKEVIKNNEDCLYNGIGYRFLSLDFFNIANESQNSYDFDSDEPALLNKEQLNDVIKQFIKSSDKFVSWAKNMEGCLGYIDEYIGGAQQGVIIFENIINGLDYQKLGHKYEDQVPNGYLKNAIDNEQEVIAPMSDSYIITALFNQGNVIDFNDDIEFDIYEYM